MLYTDSWKELSEPQFMDGNRLELIEIVSGGGVIINLAKLEEAEWCLKVMERNLEKYKIAVAIALMRRSGLSSDEIANLYNDRLELLCYEEIIDGELIINNPTQVELFESAVELIKDGYYLEQLYEEKYGNLTGVFGAKQIINLPPHKTTSL